MKIPLGRSVWIVVVLGMGVSLLAWTLAARRGRPPIAKAPEGGSVNREGARLVALKNEAIALLENGSYSAADPLFAEIATASTGDPLGPRNWVIGRILAAQSTDPTTKHEEFREWVEKAISAWELEFKLDNQGPVRYDLAGRISILNDRLEEGLFNLHRAAGLAPKNAAIWGLLYRTEKDSSEPSIREDGENALRQLFDVAPDNVYALMEWMAMQARKQDPTLSATLQRAQKVLPPLFAPTHNADWEPISRGIAAVKKSDWPEARRVVEALVGATRSRTPRTLANDKRRVDRSVLSYAPRDFYQKFYDQYPVDRLLVTKPIDVHFRELPLKGALAEFHDVRDARVFGSGEETGIAVLRRDSVAAFGRSKTGEWDETWSRKLPAGFDHVLVAPLFPKAGSKEKSPDEWILYGPAGAEILQVSRGTGAGTATFHAVPKADFQRLKDVRSVAVLDIDRDGFLDLALTTDTPAVAGHNLAIWRNTGGGFEDFSARSPLSERQAITFLAPVDWDQDGDLDLLLAGPKTSSFAYLQGSGEGRFHLRELPSIDPRFAEPKAICPLDADSNGTYDLAVAGPSDIGLLLTHNTADGVKVTERTVSPFAAQRLYRFDYDNDGYPDLIAWNQSETRVFHGGPGGEFEPVSGVLPEGLHSIAVLDAFDVDSDGDLDLTAVVADEANGTRLVLLRNDGGNSNDWLDVSLEAPPEGALPPSSLGVAPWGFGCLVQLKTGAVCQTLPAQGSVTHFGLGKKEAEVLRIAWTQEAYRNHLQPGKNRKIIEHWHSRSPPGKSPR